MRVGKRHAWSAILIALFILPLLKPAGVDAVEGPVGSFFAWTASVLPSTRSASSLGSNSGSTPGGEGDAESGRVRAFEEERNKLLDQLMRTRQRVQDH